MRIEGSRGRGRGEGREGRSEGRGRGRESREGGRERSEVRGGRTGGRSSTSSAATTPIQPVATRPPPTSTSIIVRSKVPIDMNTIGKGNNSSRSKGVSSDALKGSLDGKDMEKEIPTPVVPTSFVKVIYDLARTYISQYVLTCESLWIHLRN